MTEKPEKPENPPQPTREPTLAQALVPIAVLVGLLASSVYLFGDESSSGPNQIALMLSAGVGIIIGLLNGFPWKALEQGIVRGISLSMGAILILLVVGSLIGTWILAGIVPTMIYYGLALIVPSVFYAAACVICAVVALATGSSWTTAGTVGVALIGIATVQDLNLGLAAGAIISGAYFGDKMSPLSDTTNLAPAMSGTNLFVHIRHHGLDHDTQSGPGLGDVRGGRLLRARAAGRRTARCHAAGPRRSVRNRPASTDPGRVRARLGD